MSGWIQTTMQPAMQPNTEVGFWGKFDFNSLRLQDDLGRRSKKSTFCQHSYHTKCKSRGVGGQKKPKSGQRS